MGIIQYYPLSRVRTGFTTTGGLYFLDGKPYKGPYYVTYTGDAYAGKNPVIGENRLLSRVSTSTGARLLASAAGDGVVVSETPSGNRIIASGIPSIDSYNSTLTNSARADQQPDPSYQDGFARLKQIVPYYPVVTEVDYQRGYFKRYFAKRIADSGYVMEISFNDWNTIQSKIDPTYETYEVTDMLWQLTGPLNDTRVSQYQVKGGVFDTNKRVTEGKAKSFVGLLEFIGGNYTKFARIT